MSYAWRRNLKYDTENDKSNLAHVCAPRRFRSACASAQSDQSLCVICITYPRTHNFFSRLRNTCTLIRLGTTHVILYVFPARICLDLTEITHFHTERGEIIRANKWDFYPVLSLTENYRLSCFPCTVLRSDFCHWQLMVIQRCPR